MKKIRFAAILAALFVFGAFSANAYDCSQAVDKVAKAFDLMGDQVVKCKTSEELDALDFDSSIEKSGVSTIPDSCEDYILTNSDKTKLSKSFNGFIDKMVDTIYRLCDGMVSREEINNMMADMRNRFGSAIKDSRTLGEFINVMSTLFN